MGVAGLDELVDEADIPNQTAGEFAHELRMETTLPSSEAARLAAGFGKSCGQSIQATAQH